MTTTKKHEEDIEKAKAIAEEIKAEAENITEEDILKDLKRDNLIPSHKKEETHNIQEHEEKKDEDEENEEEQKDHFVNVDEQKEHPKEELVESNKYHHEVIDADETKVEDLPPEPKHAEYTESSYDTDRKDEERETLEVKEPKRSEYSGSTTFGSLMSDDPDSKRKKLILLFIGVVLLTVLLSGGAFYYLNQGGVNPMAAKPTATPTLAPTSTPKPTESPMKDVKIEVLNGSGTAGEAGKVSDLLKDAGFEEIETGNADKYSYKETEIRLKEDTADEVYSAIEKALSETYKVKKSTTELKDSSEYDVVVVVGSTKAGASTNEEEKEEPTSKTTPTKSPTKKPTPTSAL